MEQHTKIHGNFQREPPRGQGEPPREARPSHLDPTRGPSRSEGSNGVKQTTGEIAQKGTIHGSKETCICIICMCMYIYVYIYMYI